MILCHGTRARSGRHIARRAIRRRWFERRRGRLSSAKTAFPWGAHYVPAPTHQQSGAGQTVRRARACSTAPMPTATRSSPSNLFAAIRRSGMFYRGRWYEGLYLYAGATADDLAQRRRFDAEINRWVAWRDGGGRRAFAIPTAASSDDAESRGARSRFRWPSGSTQRKFTSPRLRWLVDYSCRDDYGLTVEQTSAWAGLFYFASRVVRPGGEARPLITWPGGNSRLIEYLGRRTGAAIAARHDGARRHSARWRRGRDCESLARQAAARRHSARHPCRAGDFRGPAVLGPICHPAVP